MPLSIAGKMRLLLPDTTRRYLRIAGLEAGRLVELGRCALPAQVIGAISAVSPTEISVGLSTGAAAILLKDCLGTRCTQPARIFEPSPDIMIAPANRMAPRIRLTMITQLRS